MKKLTTLLFLSLLLIASTLQAQKIITIKNDDLSVKISSFGAELQSIQNNKSGIEYLWQGDSAYWEGRAPVMFPVNVRFKEERFTYKGVEYEMPRMGLAKIATFQVIEKTSEKVVLELKSNKETLKFYPFPFSFKVIYELEGNKLINQFEVKNLGEETMYFALGGHPGFRFPFAENRTENRYTFTEKFNLERTEIANSLVQPNQIQWLKNEDSLPLGDSRIPNGGMFVKNMPSRKIGIGEVGGKTFVEVDLRDFPNVNLWSPPGMPFACIEPMVGHHDLADSPLAIDQKDFLVDLSTGETKTYRFSIIVNEPEYKVVNSVEEIKEAISEAKPGCLILVTDGHYTDEKFTLSAKGIPGKPILIKAQNPGKVFIKSPMKIEGDYISLIGMNFIENGNLHVFGKGNRVSRCTWDDAKSGKWIRVLPGSSEIEIDHNTFQNKTSNKNFERNCQLMQIVVRNKNENHHIHNNLFKDILKGKTGNGFETLQLITENNPFDPPTGDCNTIIEDNLFLRCNGEAEIISVKSNCNLLRRNTFRACRGSVVLRHGDDNIVSGNYFFGDGESGSGGVRIQGTEQIVANNYFQNMGQFGLGMMDGTPDDLYIRVERAQILFNTFINCNKTFVIGINHSKHPNGTVPKDCTIAGNILYADNTSEKFIDLVQKDQPENCLWQGNIAFGNNVVAEIEGFQIKNPQLAIQKNGLAFPTKETPGIEFSSGVNESVKIDLLGEKWKKNRTVGAIQFPINSIKNIPLTGKMVGTNAVE